MVRTQSILPPGDGYPGGVGGAEIYDEGVADVHMQGHAQVAEWLRVGSLDGPPAPRQFLPFVELGHHREGFRSGLHIVVPDALVQRQR